MSSFLCDLLGRVMFSELLTIIPGFLVLSIPMNLLKSRKRVRQRAPRFREFHLHSTKSPSSSLVGARWDIRFLRQLRGFRREEHTAAHVLCLFEPVGRVAQNMSKKACETNRKRSMSVGIAEDSGIL